MENQIRLKWTSHQGTILSIFDALLSTESLVDVTLACEGQYIRAHKMILSACSPYFQELINVDVNKHPIFFLKDVKYTELKALIHYMYRGEVNIAHEDLPSLLAVAQALKIRGLAEVETGNNSISDTIILPDIGNKRVPKPPPPPPVAVPVPPPPPPPVVIPTVSTNVPPPRTYSHAQEQSLVSQHMNSIAPGSIPAAVSGPPLAKKTRVETRFSQFPQVQIKLSRVVLVNPRCEVQPLPSLPIAPPHFLDPVQTTSLPSTSSSHYDSPGHSQDANYSHTGMVEDAEADGFAVKIEGTGPSDLEDKEDNSLSRSSFSESCQLRDDDNSGMADNDGEMAGGSGGGPEGGGGKPHFSLSLSLCDGDLQRFTNQSIKINVIHDRTDPCLQNSKSRFLSYPPGMHSQV